MFLDFPWYEASITYLVGLLGILEPDQVVCNVLVNVMHGVVQSLDIYP